LVGVAEGSQHATPAIAILDELIVKASATVIKNEIQDLDPFPHNDAFDRLREHHEARRQNFSLRDELDWFTRRCRAPYSISATLSTTLQHMKQKLIDHHDALQEVRNQRP
jgi:hypothetical protein